MVVQLLAGMFIGMVAASAVWALLFKSGKSRADKVHKNRNEVMHSIGEIWVQIDALIISYQSGLVQDTTVFRQSYSSKIREINHLLKPNMHLFDAYYVKYIENQIVEYNRRIDKSGSAPVITAGTAFDSEMETSLSMAEERKTADTDSGVDIPELVIDDSKQVSEDFSREPSFEAAAENDSGGGAVESPVVDEPAAQQEDLFSPDIIIPVEKLKDSKEDAPVKVEDEKCRESIEHTGGHDENIESEQEETVNGISGIGKPQTADSVSSVTDDDSEVSVEMTSAVESDTMAGKSGIHREIPNSADKENEEEVPSTAGASAKSPDEEEMAFFEATAGAATEEQPHDTVIPEMADERHNDLFGEEDFTMETLIDVDINTISPYLQAEPKEDEVKSATERDSSIFSIEPENSAAVSSDENLEVIIASDAGHTETSPDIGTPEDSAAEKSVDNDNNDADAIPEETTFTPAASLEKKGAGNSETTEEDFEVVVAEGEKEEIIEIPAAPGDDEQAVAEDGQRVTGDDVAAKIGTLETASVTMKDSKKAGKSEMKPAASPEKPTESKAGKPKKKNSKDDEGITGDDVADKIDAFFGLFQDD